MEDSTQDASSWRTFFISALVVIAAGVFKTLVMDRGWKPETD